VSLGTPETEPVPPTAPPAPALILASASPARLASLRAAGIEPTVVVSAVDEPARLAEAGIDDPEQVPLFLAKLKAEDVAAGRSEAASGAIVIGCDSVLDLDGVALGKPVDAADAVRRWQAMRGRSGVLRTGHWLIDDRDPADGGSNGSVGATSSTVVHFAAISDAEIEAYVASGEPLHVAGAFTVDGLGGAFVTGIEGDHHGVVGISLPLLRELLGELGVSWTSLWSRPRPL
jgi:septum formation protein